MLYCIVIFINQVLDNGVKIKYNKHIEVLYYEKNVKMLLTKLNFGDILVK